MATYAENPADSGRAATAASRPTFKTRTTSVTTAAGNPAMAPPLAKAWQEEQPTGDSGLRQCRRIYPTKGTWHFRTG